MQIVSFITHINLVSSLRMFGAVLSPPHTYLTLNLLMTTIVAIPSNASKWQMGFNLAFKGLRQTYPLLSTDVVTKVLLMSYLLRDVG
jgi:hypothetical protein